MLQVFLSLVIFLSDFSTISTGLGLKRFLEVAFENKFIFDRFLG